MVSQLSLIDGFNIIKGMPVDYIHGVVLGIVKMLHVFSKWFDVKYKKERFYIGDKICSLDERLSLCQPSYHDYHTALQTENIGKVHTNTSN